MTRSERIQNALWTLPPSSAASCEEREDGVIELHDLSGDSSAGAARQIGGALDDVWIRCAVSTCTACHDEECGEEEHDLLPLTAGDDVLVTCGECGAPLHCD